MCQNRPSNLYKQKHICTSCEKTFKELENGNDLFAYKVLPTYRTTKRLCPECAKPMEQVSMDFASPRKGDKQWKIFRKMQSLGKRIMFVNSCGCYSGRFVPRNNSGLRDFMVLK